MKLLGRSIDGKRLVEEIRARLAARGIREDAPDPPLDDEAPVEPYAYLVQLLEENVDPAQSVRTPSSANSLRGLVRFAARGLLEELFGRQRAFNVHVRDLAAQLSSEVITLRARVAELERLAASAPGRQGQLPKKQRAGRRPAKPRRR
jgi:hypothetical protein